MTKKLLVFAFGLVNSMVAFADFSGQTIAVDYLTAIDPTDPLVAPAENSTTITVPGSTAFTFDGGVTCTIAIDATQITINACNFSTFGTAGGVTFNGFRFTQAAAALDITAVTPSGPVTAVTSNADSIAVNLINQNLQAGTAGLTVTFAAPVVNGSQPIPAVGPLGLGLLGLLLAGISYRSHRRR